LSKKHVNFRAPESLVSRVRVYKSKKGFEDLTTTYIHIIDEYLSSANKNMRGGVSIEGGLGKAVLEELELLRLENQQLVKMLLIIGTKDQGTAEDLRKHFPEFFKRKL